MAINVLDTFKPAQVFLRCFILVTDISVIAPNLAIVCHSCLHFCRRSTRILVKLKAWVQLLPRPPTEHIQACSRDRETTQMLHTTIQHARKKCKRSSLCEDLPFPLLCGRQKSQ